MSADGTSSARKPDVTAAAVGQAKDAVPAAGQGADAGTTADAKRQDHARAHQPTTKLNRHDHAQAILAGTPGHPRETPGISAAPDHEQPGKPGQAPLDHGGQRKDADTTADPKGQVHVPPGRQPFPALLRTDHANAMLAGTPGRPREAAAGTETRPDQRADEQRWAAVEQRLRSVESDRDQLRQEVNGLKADRDASEARHKAEIDSIKAEYEARISDLEANAAKPGEHQDAQATGDGTGGDAGLADAGDFGKASTGGPDKVTQPESDRSVFSPEDVEFAKSAAGLLTSAGISLPGADLILGGDSTRRAMEKMPPEHQLRTMRLAETFGNLSGGMSPGTAVLAFGASVVGPGFYAKARDVIHKILRHKD